MEFSPCTICKTSQKEFQGSSAAEQASETPLDLQRECVKDSVHLWARITFHPKAIPRPSLAAFILFGSLLIKCGGSSMIAGTNRTHLIRWIQADHLHGMLPPPHEPSYSPIFLKMHGPWPNPLHFTRRSPCT